MNDPLYNHDVFGPLKGRGGDIGGKTDEELVRDLINIHNAENWLGIDGDCELSLFKTMKADSDDGLGSLNGKGMFGLCFWGGIRCNLFFGGVVMHFCHCHCACNFQLDKRSIEEKFATILHAQASYS